MHGFKGIINSPHKIFTKIISLPFNGISGTLKCLGAQRSNFAKIYTYFLNYRYIFRFFFIIFEHISRLVLRSRFYGAQNTNLNSNLPSDRKKFNFKNYDFSSIILNTLSHISSKFRHTCNFINLYVVTGLE